MKAYSQDLRDKVISAYKTRAVTRKKISDTFGICYGTACDWIKRYETTGDYSSQQGVGCGREQRFTDKQKILDYLALNPDSNGIEIRDAVSQELPMSTFYDTLSRLEITYKKKSLYTNKEARLLEKNL
jgi:transposase